MKKHEGMKKHITLIVPNLIMQRNVLKAARGQREKFLIRGIPHAL